MYDCCVLQTRVTTRLSSTVHEERLVSAPISSVMGLLSARTYPMKPTAVSVIE